MYLLSSKSITTFVSQNTFLIDIFLPNIVDMPSCRSSHPALPEYRHPTSFERHRGSPVFSLLASPIGTDNRTTWQANPPHVAWHIQELYPEAASPT